MADTDGIPTKRRAIEQVWMYLPGTDRAPEISVCVCRFPLRGDSDFHSYQLTGASMMRLMRCLSGKQAEARADFGHGILRFDKLAPRRRTRNARH